MKKRQHEEINSGSAKQVESARKIQCEAQRFKILIHSINLAFEAIEGRKYYADSGGGERSRKEEEREINEGNK